MKEILIMSVLALVSVMSIGLIVGDVGAPVARHDKVFPIVHHRFERYCGCDKLWTTDKVSF